MSHRRPRKRLELLPPLAANLTAVWAKLKATLHSTAGRTQDSAASVMELPAFELSGQFNLDRTYTAGLADRHYRLGAVPIATFIELQKQ